MVESDYFQLQDRFNELLNSSRMALGLIGQGRVYLAGEELRESIERASGVPAGLLSTGGNRNRFPGPADGSAA